MQNNQQKIIVANWKMKLGINESINLAKEVKKIFSNDGKDKQTQSKGDVVICPNFISLLKINKILQGSNIKMGAQNVFWEERGAYTGEISPATLKEAGCKYVIIGHSERREYLLENYEMIHKTVKAVLSIGGIIPVVCIGEDRKDRKTNKRDIILVEQLQQALGGLNITKKEQIIVAYEPIWAIGSGVAMEPDEADYAHKIIKLTLNEMFGIQAVENNFRVIYGGSISGANVKSFVGLENIDGLLVGGASLDAKEFYKIAKVIL